MADKDAFTLVSEASQHKVFDDYEELSSGHLIDPQTYLTAVFRRQYPELAVTCTSASNPALLAFAAAGYATAELDTTEESINRFRGYVPGNARYGYTEGIYESRYFAKYNYRWGDEFFILYVIIIGYNAYNFILKEPGNNETTLSNPKVVDELIMACGRWMYVDNDFIYVYDGYWTASKSLWQQVQKASWDDVILNEEMKKTLVSLMTKFFDSEDVYKSLGVPWKRGVIFHGPAGSSHPSTSPIHPQQQLTSNHPGNGKTISIKALMHSLSKSKDRTIPALYVKSAPRTYDIRSIFVQARAMAPCMLILEDIDTIVTATSRSYFFNEVDGLENNDGIFMVASTNHLDRLDPGLSSRPSRFDRKYLFPLPSEHERTLYCEYWRDKLKSKPSIKFPRKLSPAIAGITEEFSFAYLQEAFVATLLAIAGHRSEERVRGGGEDEGGDLDDYELWREMKNQVKALRDDMGNNRVAASAAGVDLPEMETFAEMEGAASTVREVVKSSALPIRSKEPMTLPHDIKDQAVQNKRIILDRNGKEGFSLPVKDGAPKIMPLFSRDGKMYGEGFMAGNSSE
ncbi:MAG: hypothetical protein LQ343_000947 [Gyalolechia ehrenbergii]|nr:MAG: hypothetical protein LQ343_000947 [Gyalolechia ehrenbergii]